MSYHAVCTITQVGLQARLLSQVLRKLVGIYIIYTRTDTCS